MSDRKYHPGRVVWRELMTKDAAAARAFYSGLFGWKYQDVDMGGGANYSRVQAGGKEVGGLWQMAPGQTDASAWMVCVSVEDVEAAARAAAANGGKVLHGPQDSKEYGSYAVIADFAGAVICAYRGPRGDSLPEMMKPGEFCWETVTTPDAARAKDFYGKVFGWQTQPGMGGEATMLFAVDGTPEGQVADVQQSKDMPPNWVTYVVVEKLEASREKAEKLGAQVVVPLVEVPSVGRITFIADPTGAMLGLFEPGPRA